MTAAAGTVLVVIFGSFLAVIVVGSIVFNSSVPWLATAAALLFVGGGAWIVADGLCGFIRVDAEGVTYRYALRVSRARWTEIRGVTFKRLGKKVVWMELRRPGMKRIAVDLNHYPRDARRRVVEMIQTRLEIDGDK